MGLMDDLNRIYGLIKDIEPSVAIEAFKSYQSIRAFIAKHEPWCPPQQEGFGPWIEYEHGKDKGPRVNDAVMILTEADRKEKRAGLTGRAGAFAWKADTAYPIVAYCVKLDEAKP